MLQTIKFTIFSLLLIAIIGCSKSKYLDAKPNEKLVVPESLQDFQAILDNDNYMNGNSFYEGVVPFLGETGCDDYYVNSSINSLTDDYLNLYKWDDNIYSNGFNINWSFGYRCVFYSNVVLDGLSKTNVAQDLQTSYNNIKGSALFYRSFTFFQLAQVFAPVYDSSTAKTDLGLALRLTSDINEAIQRASVQETYDRIITDLKNAAPLLPVIPLYKTRPSRPAAYALLAKTYLSMRDYNNAFLYSDSCLQIVNDLLDYSKVDTLDGGPFSFPFALFNTEVIFHSQMIGNPIVLSDIGRVDSLLFISYDTNDLRKKLFFSDLQGSFSFRGSYTNSSFLFSGLATDEIYLIRAECNARKNNINDAMTDLNILLQKRWKDGLFLPFTASSPEEALTTILLERRKELVFRGSRWTDLRRLNREGANISITRILNGQTFILTPNSLKYTYLIPPDVIGFNTGMQQNPR